MEHGDIIMELGPAVYGDISASHVDSAQITRLFFSLIFNTGDLGYHHCYVNKGVAASVVIDFSVRGKNQRRNNVDNKLYACVTFQLRA